MTTDLKAIIAAGACALAIGVIGTSVVLHEMVASRRAADRQAVVSTGPQHEAAPPVPERITRDGVYVAGRQIKTGTYTAEGGSFCYWARLKHTPSGTTSILVSSYVPGLQVVAIVAGDIFQTSGCSSWEPVR